jgi:Rieske Fe-S protein
MDDTTAVTTPQQQRTRTSRRALLGAGVGVPVLAACGSDDADSGDSGGSPSSEASGGLTAPASDIPVGGGAIFESDEVVITQPVEGEFKAFGAICTHQSCLVSQVTEEGIGCTCHGSLFSLEDGSVIDGPAEEGLPELTVTAEGTDVTVG